MSVSRLPSGRYRAEVHVPGKGNVAVSKILGGVGTFRTKREAKQAVERARQHLATIPLHAQTLAGFWGRWITDPLFARPKESTNGHNRERTKGFVAAYGHLPMRQIDDTVAAEWLAGGQRNTTVPAIRAMLNDAASAKGGRLIERNAFAGLGISRGRGNRDTAPPPEEQVWQLIAQARKVTSPAFAAWLQVAAFTGIRPGELDALRWSAIDFEHDRIHVREQFSAATGVFTLPKNGRMREAPLTQQARAALIGLSHESEFCFTNLRGDHFTASSRAYHWKAVRAGARWTGSLYLATRHFAGSYMVNVLELPSEDVAIALGHTDGGQLVRQLYGHRDQQRALDRVAVAYAGIGDVEGPPSAASEAGRGERRLDAEETAHETAHETPNLP